MSVFVGTAPEVRRLCLWLRLVGAGLELVEVRQLLPVVVLVLVGVVVVGAHNVVGHAGRSLLRPRGSEVVERDGQSVKEAMQTQRCRTRILSLNNVNEALARFNFYEVKTQSWYPTKTNQTENRDP